jgi:hypothetical protein
MRTLYHPSFEPKESWLRTLLLFYDTVHSIVPEDADYRPSPKIATLCDEAQDAFVPLAPSREDVEYDYDDYGALADVLRHLSSRDDSEDRINAHFYWPDGVPSLDLGEGVKVHADKLADMLAYDLVGFGLAERTDDPEWLRVDRQVADLVLSMLADRMANNRAGIVCTSSDRDQSFAVAAKSELRHDNVWNPEAALASAILTAEVPADLADLPLKRYLDIRKRYEDERDVFQLAMKEMQLLHLKQNVQSPEAFRDQVQEAVSDFGRGMQKLRKGRLGREIRRWAPVAIGGIVSLASAAIATPIVGVGAAGVALTVQVLQNSQGQHVPGTYKAKAQALLVELDRDVRWNRNWLGRVFSR